MNDSVFGYYSRIFPPEAGSNSERLMGLFMRHLRMLPVKTVIFLINRMKHRSQFRERLLREDDRASHQMLFDQFESKLEVLGDDEDSIRHKIETIRRRLRSTMQLSEVEVGGLYSLDEQQNLLISDFSPEQAVIAVEIIDTGTNKTRTVRVILSKLQKKSIPCLRARLLALQPFNIEAIRLFMRSSPEVSMNVKISVSVHM
jgi:hypothetical protein